MNSQLNTQPIRLYAWTGAGNFGDELSPFLIKKITNCRVISVSSNTDDKLVAIGSVINNETLLSCSSFWGSGVLTKNTTLTKKFRLFPINRALRYFHQAKRLKNSKFYALRGPLSAEKLELSGIDKNRIPKVFSDPAILTPYVYQPQTSLQRFEIGIILHHIQDCAHLESIINEHYHSKIKFISIFRSTDAELKQFIDEVCSCNLIASCSLHGIILAQAYGIPSLFLQNLSQPIQDNCVFKYHDYFKGTNQEAHEPFKFSRYEELIPQLYKQKFIEAPNFRQLCQNLLDVFPYPDRLQLKNLPY